ncbi:hypothetical protein D1872_51590 [compost metagenome]
MSEKLRKMHEANKRKKDAYEEIIFLVSVNKSLSVAEWVDVLLSAASNLVKAELSDRR